VDHVTKQELGDAIQLIAEQMNALEASVAKLQGGLLAVEAMLALQMNPSAPKQALERIRKLEKEFAKRDPNAAARKQFSEVLEMVKVLEKHGGAKEA
jgi:hypothetical protein